MLNAANAIQRFVNETFGDSAIIALAKISPDLKKVQTLRNPSGHYRSTSGTDEAEEMRDAVIGKATTSILGRLLDVI